MNFQLSCKDTGSSKVKKRMVYHSCKLFAFIKPTNPYVKNSESCYYKYILLSNFFFNVLKVYAIYTFYNMELLRILFTRILLKD